MRGAYSRALVLLQCLAHEPLPGGRVGLLLEEAPVDASEGKVGPERVRRALDGQLQDVLRRGRPTGLDDELTEADEVVAGRLRADPPLGLERAVLVPAGP